MHLISRALVLAPLALFALGARAMPTLDELSTNPHRDWLTLSGLSHHFQPDRRDWREANPGVGFEREFDAAGRYVAPGFIDVHTHCEGDLEKRPEAENFVRMGVTSIVTGNCGSSYLNLADETAAIAWPIPPPAPCWPR